jgi:oxygen-independent coproporphyrinogen-3 oxidase
METIASKLTTIAPLDSIFFGGGTPSLMPANVVQKIIERAYDLFGFAAGIEISLEANPTSADADRFRDYQAVGVNRLSLGVQALNDADLKALGRLHTADEALKAVSLAQSIFKRVSFDLIYARPAQTEDQWLAELERALSFGCTHHSLYQLTFEEGTPYHAALMRGTMKELNIETAASLFEQTQIRMNAEGLPAYEVSNHATPGEESRHNLVYWRYGDYVGVGPGAHGRLTIDGKRIATETARMPEEWLQRVAAQGDGVTKWDIVSEVQQGTEALLMGLRLSEGVDLKAIEQKLGRRISQHRLTSLEALGFVQTERPVGSQCGAQRACRLNSKILATGMYSPQG